jgi:tetratricopeptide (TPR) repeat protein
MGFLLPLIVHAVLTSDPAANIAAGDDAFYRIEYATAISSYEAALESNVADPELLWRLARAYVCSGEVAGEGERQRLFDAAELHARKCVKVDSTKAEGHTWLAAAIGYTAFYAGTKEQIRLSHEIRTEFEKALALNPNDDAAYSIEGSFYRAMGNVSWLKRRVASILFGSIPDGGFEEAEKALKHAIEIAPDVMRHYYELGVLYIDWDRPEDARKALEQASVLPVRVAIDRPRLAKTRELLIQLRSKEH